MLKRRKNQTVSRQDRGDWEGEITYNIPRLKRRNKEAILIAEGPSREIIFKNPSLAEGKDVALVNRAGIRWEHPAYMWYTYHPENLNVWYKARKERGFPVDGLVAIYWQKDIKIDPELKVVKIKKGPRLGSGGTSAFFAATCLLSMGYEQIDMYGVDLLERGYWRSRRFWKPLAGAPIITHSKDGWFQNNKFPTKSLEPIVPSVVK